MTCSHNDTDALNRSLSGALKVAKSFAGKPCSYSLLSFTDFVYGTKL